jgi:hypothetical protein
MALVLYEPATLRSPVEALPFSKGSAALSSTTASAPRPLSRRAGTGMPSSWLGADVAAAWRPPARGGQRQGSPKVVCPRLDSMPVGSPLDSWASRS